MCKFKSGDKCRELANGVGTVFEVDLIISDDWFTVKGQNGVAFKCSNFELVELVEVVVDKIPLDWDAAPGAETSELRAVQSGTAHLRWELFKWGERIRELDFYEINFVNSAILATTKALEGKTESLAEENEQLHEGINVLISEVANLIQYIHDESNPIFYQVSSKPQILQSLCVYLQKLYKLSNGPK